MASNARPRLLSSEGLFGNEAPGLIMEGDGQSAVTLSGASGQRLANELAKWMSRGKQGGDALQLQPRNIVESVEIRVNRYYDYTFGVPFNLLYDILQFSSGRDKFCGLLQNFAKIAAAAFVPPDSERYYMCRGIEDSLSEGRKIFRLFKEYREVYKIRRGFQRMQTGIAEAGVRSIPAVCGALDTLAHVDSLFFYLFDNLLWAASVGIFRAKEVPRWQRDMWVGFRRNGPVVSYLGGVTGMKRKKDFASIWRIVFAFIANVLLLRKAIRECSAKGGEFQGPDDPRLFHSLELVGMAASFRDLLSRLRVAPMTSQVNIGLLGMIGAGVGLWSNYRKVCKDKCGTKRFVSVAEQRAVQEAALRRETPWLSQGGA